jgi:hypothetical protein
MITQEGLIFIALLFFSTCVLWVKVSSYRRRYNSLWQSYSTLYQEHQLFYAEISSVVFAKDKRVKELHDSLNKLSAIIRIDTDRLANCANCNAEYARIQHHQRYCSKQCKRQFARKKTEVQNA